VTLEGEVLPWVSMAEALGWGLTERPCNSIVTRADGGAIGSALDGGAGARAMLDRERDRGAWRMWVQTKLPDGEGRNIGGHNWLKGEDWPERRPATTIAGDSRVFQPGGHHQEGEQSHNAIRVREQEAAILQGFPPDYPWQGTRSKRYQQIGNAVPPPLARAVLSVVVPEPVTAKEVA
jgi:DNA (cytosine-5)-methyltransferase 1